MRYLARLAWFALPVYALGFIAWPAGLFMVWSARDPSISRALEAQGVSVWEEDAWFSQP